jgi:hypothetical protein
LESDGSLYLPFIPFFIVRTYEHRQELSKTFKEVKFLSLQAIRSDILIVRGHESVPDHEMRLLGKQPNQLDNIKTTMSAVESGLSSTGPLMEKKNLKRFVLSILNGREVEEMKMIRFELLREEHVGIK